MNSFFNHIISNTKKYYTSYVVILIQFSLWMLLIWSNLEPNNSLLKLLLSIILFTQIFYIFNFSLHTLSAKLKINKTVEIGVNLLISFIISLIVYLYSFYRAESGLNPIDISITLLSTYLISLALVYNNNAVSLWNYCYNYIVNNLISYFFSLLFFGGIGLIFLALTTLFKIEIIEEVYSTAACFSFVIISNLLILNRYSEYSEETKDFEFYNAWKILSNYISAPILIIYQAILLIYFATILFTGDIPNNQISTLILFLFIPGIATIFVAYPQIKQSRFIYNISRIWLVVSILLSGMLFYGMSIRIINYGFTVDRLLVILIAIVFNIVFLLFIFQHKHTLTLSLLSLAIVPFILNFTLFINIHNISNRDQSNRLLEDLKVDGRIKNNIINNGFEYKNSDLYFSRRSTLEYIAINHGLSNLDDSLDNEIIKDLNLTSQGFRSEDSKDIFTYILGESEFIKDNLSYKTINVSSVDPESPINVSDFNTLTSIDYYPSNSSYLKIISTGKVIDVKIKSMSYEFDLSSLIRDVNIEKSNYSQEELVFASTDKKAKIIIQSMSLDIDSEGNINVNNLNGYILY